MSDARRKVFNDKLKRINNQEIEGEFIAISYLKAFEDEYKELRTKGYCPVIEKMPSLGEKQESLGGHQILLERRNESWVLPMINLAKNH